ERDMNDMWTASLCAITGAIKNAQIDGKDIVAISLTGHGNGAHLLDSEKKPVRRTIEGADSRGLSLMKVLENEGYYEKIHPLNMQILWPALSFVVMRWLKENEPENYKNVKYFLNAHDYIRFKLTGMLYSEITDISGTGLLNTKEQRIDREMLKLGGIEEVADMIPPLVGSFDEAGKITNEVAELTGLRDGVPVFAGCYDIDSAALATGSVDESRICIIAGTWANNQYIGKTPVVAKEFFSTTIFSRPGYWLMLEGSPTSASNMEWFVGEFLQEEKKLANAAGLSVYALCNNAIRDTNPEDTDLIYLPFLYGSNVNPLAQASFIGLQGWHERKHVIRAIYEGICFSHRYHIEKLLKYLTPPEAARIAGGASKSYEWAQMFADVLQIPIELTKTSELGTLGAVICSAVGAGYYSNVDEAVAGMVKIAGVVTPDSNKKAIYDRKYSLYINAINALDHYWNK
ncbi:MAG: carbohydrate kinase, partial [Anaerolineaceae bacterium]|nr:carbohydrate kinase [Anaerolineaceae bacterium]